MVSFSHAKESTMHKPIYLPYVLALLSGGIWGLTFSLARMATEAGEEPLGLALWQALGGALVLLVYCVARRLTLRLTRDMLRHCLVIGFFGSALPGALLFYAAPHVASGVLAITIAIVPIQTFGLSLLLGRDRYSRKRLTGIALGFVAVMLIVLPGAESVNISSLNTPASPFSTQVWIVIALVATVAYTIENVYVDRYVSDDTPLAALLVGGFVTAVIMLLPLVWYNQAFVFLTRPFDRLDAVLVMMAVVSSLAYLMFLVLIKLAGPVFASFSGYVVTLSGVFWGMAIFGESHSLWIWLALLFILVGMALVTPMAKSTQ